MNENRSSCQPWFCICRQLIMNYDLASGLVKRLLCVAAYFEDILYSNLASGMVFVLLKWAPLNQHHIGNGIFIA